VDYVSLMSPKLNHWINIEKKYCQGERTGAQWVNIVFNFAPKINLIEKQE
jgi:hypothetical protein